MEIRQLNYFVTTAEELHFKRAAARLEIAQPSLTEQIHKLEEELSVRLFDRNSHRVALTPAGRTFLHRARRTLRSARLVVEGAVREDRAADQVGDHAGRLTVGYVCPAASELVPRALRMVRAVHPAVAVSISEAWSRVQLDGLLAEEIDVGFVFGATPDRRLVLLPVLEQQMSILLPEGHPLADRPWLCPADLVTEPLVLFTRELSPDLHDRLCAAAAESGTHLDVRHTVTEAVAAHLLVEAGHGLAVVTSARQTELRSSGVVHRPLVSAGGAEPSGPVHLAWRRGDRTPAVRTFVRAVRSMSRAAVPVGVGGAAWNCAS